MEVWRGSPTPLGAHLTHEGVNFALFSENAEKVVLCLFDPDGHETQIEMPECNHHIWHCFVPGLKAGQHYGYRVHGSYEPQKGLRFNANKLLLDPYARATSGPVTWNESIFAYDINSPDKDLSFSQVDSAPAMPKAIVTDSKFNWEGDEALNTPWHDTVIYEAHLKGFTQLNNKIPKELRGTYAGVGHSDSISYLKELGVTAVEFLPIHQFVEEDFLKQKGLKNYWGYSSIGFFAPEWRYAHKRDGEQVVEFKNMVKALHAAGLEVILDVVYNHTVEGNHLGPTLSFKGIDNQSYYRLTADNPQFYMDYTGCGNTLNVVNHHTLRLIMDSLRYWVEEMHVDGFRFDLASALARGFHEVDQLNSFFGIIQQDPILSRVKLIAEPWDLGEGGYQVGSFPNLWTEWNDKYRDTLRKFWRGDDGLLSELADRLMGSSDLYESSGRRPHASINLITAHDGFTLHDLVTYNQKHNEANLEENRDGNDNNNSWNCGVEGETEDLAINNLRAQMKRNFLSTLFLSQGVPMLVAGDEFGRTQQGNNNAYCQDNEISWLNWEKFDADLFNFAKNLIELRKEHRVFHRRFFFQGESIRPGQNKDLIWFLANGHEMTDAEWEKDFAKSIGIFLNGEHLNEKDSKNNRIKDHNFIWLLNASHVEIAFHFPKFTHGKKWVVVFDTIESWPEQKRNFSPIEPYPLQARSSVLLRQKD